MSGRAKVWGIFLILMLLLPGAPVALAKKKKLPDLSRTICRLYIEWESEGTFADLFAQFVALPRAERSPAVIFSTINH